jgi:TctA family transporter
MSKRTNRTGRAGRAVAWGVAKRLLQRTPVVGTVLTVGLAGYEIKRKGVVKGALNVALNATPVIGTVKGVVEIFTGDLLSDKKEEEGKKGRQERG